MYFKKLELIGFKSFAEKTKLHFEPGVTTIVGPNGCGKSNITDAIKWVFGEQSAKSLRASRMEDVIFNGTDQTEPINLAEVSITFSNESKILPIEYDEVIITRRLFRSGESEYLLNKMPVRLKDIQELLMGTGIGAESYSLIEQGEIDLILSSKPEERRYIFEEASGITKYKSKKKEALNKLEQTENNLLRVNDIINEVRRQISSIERQAKKAERYKSEFEKLKELDTRFSLFNYKKLKNEEKIISVEIGDLKHKTGELTTRIAHFSEVTEKLKADMERISDKFSSLQLTLLETSSAIDKNSHKISVNKERIGELERSKLSLNEEIKRGEARRIEFEDALNILKQKASDFTGEKRTKENLINQKEERHTSLSKEVELHRKDIADSKNRTVENLARQSKLNNEKARLSTEIQSHLSRLKRLQIEKEKVGEELNSSEAEFSQIDSEEKSLQGLLSKLNEERLSCQKQEVKHKERLQALNAEVAGCQKEMDLLKSRLQFLEELMASREGLDKGAKYILDAKRKGQFLELDGPICDIVDVEKGFESALELTLGAELQSFIVKTRAEAKGLLSHFKDNNLGRVSLIIIEDLPKTGPTKPIVKYGLKALADIIRTKDEYKDILQCLLKDIYIAEDAEKAFDVINKLAPAAKVIIKDGELIQKGRAWSGPQKRSSDVSLIGRKRKADETLFKIEEFDKKIIQLNEAIKSEESLLHSMEDEIGSKVDQLRKDEIKLANINTKKQTTETQLNRLKDEEVLLRTEIEELRQVLQELNNREGGIKKSLKETGDEHLSLENFIIDYQDSIEKKSKQKEELLVELTQYKTELVSLSREEKSLLESLAREENTFNEISSGIEAKKKQLIDETQRTKELEEEDKSLELQNSKNASEKKTLEKDIEKTRDEKAHLSQDISKEDQKMQGQKQSLEQLRDDLHGLEMKKTGLSYKQNSLRERTLQAYKVDLDEVQVALEEGIDWEEIRANIEELKAKIEKMGTVNLVAIEEHRELEERFNFLTHQEQDLLNAKDSLLKAIQKINKTTRSLFFDTFTKIQAEFRNFFRLLFGGGQAELLLLDERDILESGIEIIVRPPGKKLQNISLLSGGEKALTAIALLFAIFKVKPSPFCVLDEIDAPLDESNVGRFSNVLKEFVKSSQFIIITHNKKTIGLSDVMYGITMEKSGISKIVSVKFADDRKEKEKAEILA